MISEAKRRGEASDFAWGQLRAQAERLGTRRPGKRWSRDARALIDELGESAVVAELVAGLRDADPAYVPAGLVALAGLLAPETDLAAAIGVLAERSYRRVPLKGIASLTIGNACVRVLVSFGELGAPQLSMLLARASYPSVRRRLERALDELARETHLPRDVLDEINLPDFGLDASGERVIETDHGACHIRIAGSLHAELRWSTAGDGCARRRPPRCAATHRRSSPSCAGCAERSKGRSQPSRAGSRAS